MDAILIKNGEVEEICPRCQELPFPRGKYFDRKFIVRDVPIRFWIINIKVSLEIRIQYCSGCGFLKVVVNMA